MVKAIWLKSTYDNLLVVSQMSRGGWPGGQSHSNLGFFFFFWNNTCHYIIIFDAIH